jgi:hypothetical protein
MVVTFKRGPAQVYDVLSADPVTVPIPFDARNCDWDAGNNILATASSTHTVLWNLSPVPESAENLRLEAEVSACQHLDGLSGQLPLNRFEIMERWNKLHPAAAAGIYTEK